MPNLKIETQSVHIGCQHCTGPDLISCCNDDRQVTTATLLKTQASRGWFGKTSEEPTGCSHKKMACTAMLISIRIATLSVQESKPHVKCIEVSQTNPKC